MLLTLILETPCNRILLRFRNCQFETFHRSDSSIFRIRPVLNDGETIHMRLRLQSEPLQLRMNRQRQEIPPVPSFGNLLPFPYILDYVNNRPYA